MMKRKYVRMPIRTFQSLLCCEWYYMQWEIIAKAMGMTVNQIKDICPNPTLYDELREEWGRDTGWVHNRGRKNRDTLSKGYGELI